jgi:hypothetical protein
MIIYIYALLEPDTDDVRYVGKSVNPDKRLYQHCHPEKNAKRLSAEWITSLLVQGKTPKLVILEECGIDTWDESERRWIAHYKSIGMAQTNIAAGGMNRTNRASSIPTIAISRQASEWLLDQYRNRNAYIGDVIRETIQAYADEVGLFGEERPTPYGKRESYSYRLPMTSVTQEMRDWLEERSNVCDVGIADVVRSAFNFCMTLAKS